MAWFGDTIASMSANYSVRIQAAPRYIDEQSQPAQSLYTFAYTITVANEGDVAVQLISRHWEIEDASGQVEMVDGLGVVGKQPLLQPGQVFEYTSGAQLRTNAGMMSGHFFFVAVDGTRFETTVPPFVLQAAGSTPGLLHWRGDIARVYRVHTHTDTDTHRVTLIKRLLRAVMACACLLQAPVTLSVMPPLTLPIKLSHGLFTRFTTAS